ncbi:MAG: dTDP-4-dehydrorhamnose reductase [Candidatus Diapherotrites archaeon]|uniref:dTDP-4-dehydrorhamnose reductase n=1 Tax=Candidatus Iainarchaeum sp. TaxID=3101447 RepID=A0A938YNL1_9ARCH|nr:dTDP-4-dehydrorhamnose reductase [Candidatus Diapherotrites archaeon]
MVDLKCLIIGYGLLGKELAVKMQEKGIEFSVASNDINEALGNRVDITSKEEAGSLLLQHKPDVVFLTAAVTNVDFCEENSQRAFDVNVSGAKNVAGACEEHGCFLVFYSTDFVFDGKKGNYSETDLPNPLNVYGKTKLEAEQAIAEAVQRCLIIRTSTLYGQFEPVENTAEKKKSFVQWVFDSLKAGNEIMVVTDQVTNPTLVDELAEASIALVGKKAKGLIHVAGRTALSRFQFAEKVAERFSLNKALIKPIETAQLGQAAKRPKDSSLSLKKLNSLGVKTKDIESALKELA